MSSRLTEIRWCSRRSRRERLSNWRGWNSHKVEAHSPPRRGGVARSAGVVGSAEILADLTTPSAPSAQPPLLCEEGNISVAALLQAELLRQCPSSKRGPRGHEQILAPVDHICRWRSPVHRRPHLVSPEQFAAVGIECQQ